MSPWQKSVGVAITKSKRVHSKAYEISWEFANFGRGVVQFNTNFVLFFVVITGQVSKLNKTLPPPARIKQTLRSSGTAQEKCCSQHLSVFYSFARSFQTIGHSHTNYLAFQAMSGNQRSHGQERGAEDPGRWEAGQGPIEICYQLSQQDLPCRKYTPVSPWHS